MIKPGISWYEKYRPQMIEEMVFDDINKKNLVETWITNERLDGNVLLSGSAGTGKSTLAQILIRTIIKNQADLFRMKSRSVTDIDEKVAPFVIRRPISSKCKIVYIEEFDRLSNVAHDQLKEDLMEKYQEYVSFVCCTNYPRKIDPAILSRFTYKLDFDSNKNFESIKARLTFILDQEKAKYNLDELTDFIEKNYSVGMRNLINSLQVSFISNEGNINFIDLEKTLNIEDNIVKILFVMTKTLMETNDTNSRKLCVITPMNSIIAKDYTDFVTLCHNNPGIDYERIFLKLNANIRFLPLQQVIVDYLEQLETKKFQHLHLISCFYSMSKCILETLM